MILCFGSDTAITNTAYLPGINGVVHNSSSGYTMPRAGSIVSVGWNFDVTSKSVNGNLDLDIDVSGGTVKFRTTPNITNTGVKNITNTQARGVTVFAAGATIVARPEFIVGQFEGTLDDFSVCVEIVFDTTG